jgi:predicted MPP superfamily phosphohydrolase
MRSFFPIIFASVLILVFGTLQAVLLRVLNRPWWHRRPIRLASLWLPVAGMVFIFLWGVGEYQNWSWLGTPMSFLAILVFIIEAGLMLSLPISGVIHIFDRMIERSRAKKALPEIESVDSRRRVFLKTAAAAVPIMTLSTGGAGMVDAFTPTKVELKPILIESLPPGLEGFRIMHLSDLHLRVYSTLDTLSAALDAAREFKPDLLLVTGDIADDLGQLPDALRMFDQFKAPYGCFATLGNHEYFRGIAEVRRIFDAGPIPLFVNDSTHLMVRGTPLFIGGIDDPRRMGTKDPKFYEETIDQTLQKSARGETMILMSHRPDAFDYAASQGIHLTLAGHTHGGQIGFMGRSIFESSAHDRYLWGEYVKGSSKLYTTSGAGHWFPFRLGCPTEAPVIELRRGVAASSNAA